MRPSEPIIRLIDAHALWTDIQMLPHNGDIISSEEVEQAIMEAPTIKLNLNVEKHGAWLKSEDSYCGLVAFKCSLCREEWFFNFEDDVKFLNYNYCPACGAKMDLEVNNG